MESIRKLSNFNFQWTKTLYQSEHRLWGQLGYHEIQFINVETKETNHQVPVLSQCNTKTTP